MLYQRSASKSASSTTLVTPLVSGETMPYEVPVTQPGSAVHQKMSCGCRSSASLPVDVVRDHGAVHVERTLGLAGGAAGEMQQRRVFGIGRSDRKFRARGRDQLPEVQRVRQRGGRVAVGDDQHMLQMRQALAQAGDFLYVELAVVTSTEPSPIMSRVCIGSGPKAENSVHTTPRFLSVPSTAT